MIKKTLVYATTEFEAIHRWDNAPSEVNFLRNPHRHIFKVKIKVAVLHNDRDVEFIMLKRGVAEYCKQWTGKDIGQTSCETLATEIYMEFAQYGNVVSVEVSEDGENGAIVLGGAK